MTNKTIDIEGVELTEYQTKIFRNIMSKLIDDAKHEYQFAIRKATEVFKEFFHLDNNRWVARKSLVLKQHTGIGIKNRYYDRDRKESSMGRVKTAEVKKKKDVVETLIEAGKRNSSIDKGRISKALESIFDVLNPEEQEDVMNVLHKKLGFKLRYKGKNK